MVGGWTIQPPRPRAGGGKQGARGGGGASCAPGVGSLVGWEALSRTRLRAAPWASARMDVAILRREGSVDPPRGWAPPRRFGSGQPFSFPEAAVWFVWHAQGRQARSGAPPPNCVLVCAACELAWAPLEAPGLPAPLDPPREDSRAFPPPRLPGQRLPSSSSTHYTQRAVLFLPPPALPGLTGPAGPWRSTRAPCSSSGSRRPGG